jgi:hypothetical protein
MSKHRRYATNRDFHRIVDNLTDFFWEDDNARGTATFLLVVAILILVLCVALEIVY